MAQQIKQLRSQLQKLMAEASAAKQVAADAQRKEAEIARRVKDLNNQIETLSRTESPYITEHAMLRYFERVLGFDMAFLADEILDDLTKAKIAAFRSGTFNKSGYSLVVKDMSIITIKT